jgi:hypothetical protein
VSKRDQMKKTFLTLSLVLLISVLKAQSIRLMDLIIYVAEPLPTSAQNIISKDGWELEETKLVDSSINMHFKNENSALIIKKYKDFDSDVYLLCLKSKFEELNKSILALNLTLIKSFIDEEGCVVNTYLGENHGYTTKIQPKSTYSIHVFNKKDFLNNTISGGKKKNTLLTKDVKHDENSDLLSNNYGEGGSGFGETPIALRKFTNLVMPQDDGQKMGKVAVRISINKNGEVIAATPGVKGTTLNDRQLWQKCKDAIMGARLAQAESATDVQIGVVVFNFKVK